MYEVINSSLEKCAELCEDLTGPVYEKYFSVDAAARKLMGHSDQYMQGRMLQQTLELVMSDEHLGEEGYVRWEVNNHLLSYGVDPSMYRNFLESIHWVVRDTLGTAWRDEDESAWQAQIQILLDEIMLEARHLGLSA